MFAPAFWSTILISNLAIIRFQVPRELVCISTADLNLKKATDKDLSELASPRIKKDGSVFYLSNGIVSWINCDALDFEDLDMLWQSEIDMLKVLGLQFGRDMIKVQLFEDEFYTTNEDHVCVKCEWVKLLKGEKQNRNFDAETRAALWIDATKIFHGYDIKRINK